MSMVMLTILQAVGIFCGYTFLTVCIPAFVFGKRLFHRRFVERVLFYYLCGNFYIMNLVFLLELLHISYRPTLFLGTVVPAFFFYVKLNHVPVRENYRKLVSNYRRLFEGQMGRKNAWLHFRIWMKKTFGPFLKRMWKLFYTHIIEWIFYAGLVAAVLWQYGTQIITRFGYAVSDLPVHNYWINGLSDNHAFVAGVYPFGFHCEVYYMHMILGVDTFVILRVFGTIQSIFIFTALLAFLRLCCKTKYLPFAGTIAIVVFGGFTFSTYFRYVAALPQEYGMIYILPGIYFLFQFFEERKAELKEDKKAKPKISRYCLAGFAMSFAMTLAAHFYDTMIAGLFCFGVAAGYIWWIFRKRYFWNILAAGLLSIAIAVLPMLIAFLTGTPLQGSLGWGMNIIKGTSSESEEEQEGEETLPDDENWIQVPGMTEEDVESDPELGWLHILTQQKPLYRFLPTGLKEGMTHSPLGTKKEQIERRITNMATFYYENALQLMQRDMIDSNYGWIAPYMLLGIAVLFGMGVFFWIIRQTFYGSKLVATAVYFVFMTTLLISGRLGIPELMSTARTVIYYVYTYPIVIVFLGDGLCYLVRLIIRWKRSMQILSLAAAAALLYAEFSLGYLKEPSDLSTLETNGAIICLTNILKEDEDFKWTIVSANDERNMALDHGWHYEMATFMYEMENYGTASRITIPTEHVYFFIEKIPVNYAGAYEGSGRRVSTVFANRALPRSGGNGMYLRENRLVMMSRFYYWAREYQKLYPNEMKVYFETDNFVCYRLEQNTYRLYNLAIDYGYNSIDWTLETEQNTEGQTE